MATMPGEFMPPIAIVDYSAIDSGLGGPRIPSQSLGEPSVKLVRPRRCRIRRQAQRLARRGFATKVVASIFTTASTISRSAAKPVATS